MTDACSSPRPAWEVLPEDLARLGYPKHAPHLYGRLFRVATWSSEGPALARTGRAFADAHLDLTLPRIVDTVPSTDGSTRIVLALADGERIEAVHMPRAVRGERVTVCLSSQVGCAMGCGFCATARMGLRRNLAAHEIVGQLLAVLHAYGPDSAARLNVVFMGMGEPLHNVDALVRALDVLCEPAGLGISPARITVSTAGHLAGLERLAAARHVPELAVSVNAVTDALRVRLMPVNKKWSLSDLRGALARWPRRPHSKITLEYVLLGGVNDGEDEADRLAAWTGDLRHIVNVIPFNAWGTATSPYREPDEGAVQRFVARLRARGCLVTVRKNRGRDVRAACGTLASEAPSAGGFRDAVPLDTGGP